MCDDCFSQAVACACWLSSICLHLVYVCTMCMLYNLHLPTVRTADDASFYNMTPANFAPLLVLYAGGGNCTLCSEGFWSAGGSKAGCQACGLGQTSPSGSVSAAACVCVPGRGGPTCALCPAGSYSLGWTTNACTSCPSGTTTVSTGNDDPSDCVCQPGYASSFLLLSTVGLILYQEKQTLSTWDFAWDNFFCCWLLFLQQQALMYVGMHGNALVAHTA